MKAHIYSGTVMHRRLRPREHSFAYQVGLLGLDLDELPRLIGRRSGFGLRRPGWLRFRRQDYLPTQPGPLATAVRDLVEERCGERPAGPIELITNLRSLGLAFNPVSFYLCHDAVGELAAIVAEITNTPWGERHCYVLPRQAADRCDDTWQFDFRKAFHISPFNGMDQAYRWTFTLRPGHLGISMENSEAGARVFSATMLLRRDAATPAQLTRQALRQLGTPLRVLAAIYLQAWRLWRKATPFHAHPDSLPPARPTPRLTRNAA